MHRLTVKVLPLFAAAVLAALALACQPAHVISAADYNRFALKAENETLWAEAEFRLRQALADAPDDARLHNNLAVALEAQGKLDEAYKEYKAAVELDAGHPSYRRNLRDFTTSHRWEYDVDDGASEEGTQ